MILLANANHWIRRIGLRQSMQKVLMAFLLLVTVGSQAQNPPPDNAITAIHVEQRGDTVQIELQFSKRAPTPSRHFLLQQPSRLVIDLDDIADLTGLQGNVNGTGFVPRGRLVSDSTRTRLVLELAKAATYAIQQDGNLLRLDIRAVAQTTAAPTAGGASVSSTVTPADPAQIRQIDFRRGPSGEGVLTVDLPPGQLKADVRQVGQRLVAEIEQVGLPQALQRKQDVNDLATPVKSISAFEQDRRVRMIIEPHGVWRYNVHQTEGQLRIDIIPAPPAAAATGPEYRGEKLSMQFQRIDVRAALQVLADFTGLNIIASDSVSGELSLRLKDVPWDQALDVILQARGLGMRRNGNVLWIAPREEMMARERLELEQKAMVSDLEPLHAEVFQLNYQRAEVFRKAFGLADDGGASTDKRNGILSRRGSAVVDTRTNQLFVTDTTAVLANIRTLLTRIDVAARQVMIEARIVEADDSFGRELGVKLGLAAQTNKAAFGNSYAGVGEQTGQTAPVASTYLNQQAVNLPAAAINGANPGAFALTLFNAAAHRFLNIELSALESEGKGKIVANPRVVTADQQAALIEQGEEIPYQQSVGTGVTATAFKKANLKLEVTPQITPDGNVVLNVDVNKDSRGTSTPGGLAINTKHVRTQVQVEDGGTVVIGGIYTLTESEQEAKVPLLGDIPLLGGLFRHRARLRDKTELLIFLTPRIVGMGARQPGS